MLTEPAISKDQLIEQMFQSYHFDVVDLIFVPIGEVSWSYVVTTGDNKKYFLKIHKARNLSQQRFQLLYDLYTKANISQIPHPIPTIENQLGILINSYPTVLFNYINGVTSQNHKLTSNQYQQLGELLGKVHQAKNIISGFSVKEKFDIPSEDEFLKVLKLISQKENYNPIQSAALKLLYPIKNQLAEELKKLEAIRKQLISDKIEFVLCHGEPTPDNIMLDRLGVVYLVDWDEPILAPKEKDLLFLSNTLEPVMTGYAKYSQDLSINPLVKNFYNHLWNIREIADFGGRIFIENLIGKEGDHALLSLKHFLNYSGLGMR